MINHRDILQLCRLCLVEEKVNHPIFEEAGDLRSIFLKITSCLPVSIRKDDSLPKKICDSCISKLDSLYEFWNETANAEKQMLQWLNESALNSVSKITPTEAIKNKMENTQVKEEIDIGDTKAEAIEMSSEAQTYILQQQQLPYSSIPPKIIPTPDDTEEPAPKRPRRASAMKALEQMETDEEDDDFGAENFAKSETEDSDKEGGEETYAEPSTSMDDQPGPSGMGKGTTEAPRMVQSKSKTHSLLVYDPGTRRTFREIKEEDIIIKQEDDDFTQRLIDDNNLEKCIGGFKKRMLSKYASPKKKRYRKDDPRKIPCKICNRRFTFNYLLKIHFHNDIESNEYKCCLCGNVFSTDASLRTHLSTVHAGEAAKLKCDQCGKSYTYEGDLFRHIKTKHEGFIYKCDVCEKTFNRNQALKDHILVKHDETYVKPKYPCSTCDKIFSCKKTLMLHVKNIHHGLRQFYVCDMCGKSLATPNSFRNHLRTHTKDKPFPCGICGKRFGRNHHLQDHLVTHTKEKPHICSKCGKAFTQRAPLLRHNKCVHETARPYQCLICLKSFATKSLLHTHAKLHNIVN